MDFRNCQFIFTVTAKRSISLKEIKNSIINLEQDDIFAETKIQGDQLFVEVEFKDFAEVLLWFWNKADEVNWSVIEKDKNNTRIGIIE